MWRDREGGDTQKMRKNDPVKSTRDVAVHALQTAQKLFNARNRLSHHPVSRRLTAPFPDGGFKIGGRTGIEPDVAAEKAQPAPTRDKQASKISQPVDELVISLDVPDPMAARITIGHGPDTHRHVRPSGAADGTTETIRDTQEPSAIRDHLSAAPKADAAEDRFRLAITERYVFSERERLPRKPLAQTMIERTSAVVEEEALRPGASGEKNPFEDRLREGPRASPVEQLSAAADNQDIEVIREDK